MAAQLSAAVRRVYRPQRLTAHSHTYAPPTDTQLQPVSRGKYWSEMIDIFTSTV